MSYLKIAREIVNDLKAEGLAKIDMAKYRSDILSTDEFMVSLWNTLIERFGEGEVRTSIINQSCEYVYISFAGHTYEEIDGWCVNFYLVQTEVPRQVTLRKFPSRPTKRIASTVPTPEPS